MQVFIPYQSPIDVAKCLDRRRLHKQILEANQILSACLGESKVWRNHPVVKMYIHHTTWLSFYRDCLKSYLDDDIEQAQSISDYADELYRPNFITSSLCDQHKRRLFTKDPSFYSFFSSFGTSVENWYIVNGQKLVYINGKLINKEIIL